MWAEERDQIIRSVGPFLTKRQRERSAYCYRKEFSSAKDKPTKAQSIRGRMAMGKVYFPNTDQGREIVAELLRFPAGRNDDQVDVLSLLGRMLDQLVGGDAPKPEPEPIRGLDDMTMDELWDKMRPKSNGRPERI